VEEVQGAFTRAATGTHLAEGTSGLGPASEEDAELLAELEELINATNEVSIKGKDAYKTATPMILPAPTSVPAQAQAQAPAPAESSTGQESDRIDETLWPPNAPQMSAPSRAEQSGSHVTEENTASQQRKAADMRQPIAS
jgi:hypothetical protein